MYISAFLCDELNLVLPAFGGILPPQVSDLRKSGSGNYYLKRTFSFFTQAEALRSQRMRPHWWQNIVDTVPKNEERARAHARFRSASACVKK